MTDRDEPARVTEDARTGSSRSMPYLGMGALIGICAGMGMVLGILLGNLVLGMISGAAVGTVFGAIVEMRRRSGPDGGSDQRLRD